MFNWSISMDTYPKTKDANRQEDNNIQISLSNRNKSPVLRLKKVTRSYTDRQLTKKHGLKQSKILEWIYLKIFMEPNLRCEISQDILAKNANCTRQYVNECISLFIARGELEAYTQYRWDYDKSAPLVFSVPLTSPTWLAFRKLKVADEVPVRCPINHFSKVLTHYMLENALSVCKQEGEVNVQEAVTKEEGEGAGRGADMISNDIPKHFDNLKNIRLTKWGKIKLSCYPAEAVRYADEKLPTHRSNASLIQKMDLLCTAYCYDHNLTPNWKLAAHLKALHPNFDAAPYELPAQEIKKKPEQKRNGSEIPTEVFGDAFPYDAEEPIKWAKRPNRAVFASQGTPAQQPQFSQEHYDSLPSNVYHPYKKIDFEPLPKQISNEEIIESFHKQKTQDPKAANFLLRVFGRKFFDFDENR